MAAGRHRRRLSRWTRVRRALTGALTPGADGRHRRTHESAELLVLRGEVTDLRATIARLRDQLAALRADAVVSAATLEAARSHAAAQLVARTTGSQLQISLLLPLVREAMARSATPAPSRAGARRVPPDRTGSRTSSRPRRPSLPPPRSTSAARGTPRWPDRPVGSAVATLSTSRLVDQSIWLLVDVADDEEHRAQDRRPCRRPGSPGSSSVSTWTLLNDADAQLQPPRRLLAAGHQVVAVDPERVLGPGVGVRPPAPCSTFGSRTLIGPAGRSASRSRHASARSRETLTCSSRHSNRAWQSPSVRVTTRGTSAGSSPYARYGSSRRRSKSTPGGPGDRPGDAVRGDQLAATARRRRRVRARKISLPHDQVLEVGQPAADRADGLRGTAAASRPAGPPSGRRPG